jgi:serine/threonine protein kinase
MSVEGTIRGGGSALSAGSEFAGFRIERPLGRGGMGIVYLAGEIRLERLVALKVIRAELAEDERFRARFRAESRTAASVEHPRVVTVFGAGERDGLLYVAMRYVPGTDLGRLISAEGPLDAEGAADLIAQVGEGLDAVHAAGLVHRDVKPANVIVGEPDPGERRGAAYLTDFGLAKAMASTAGLTATGEVIGTVDYMAPEQIEGRRVDARTDVYALGCLLFHAVTGEVPFPNRESTAKMWAHMNEPPPAAGSGGEDRSSVLDPVIRRAMAKEPARRFPSAGDLGRAAVAATRGEAVTEPERPVGSGEAAPLPETIRLDAETTLVPTTPMPRPRRRRRRLIAILLVLLVMAGLGAAAVIEAPRLSDSGKSASRSGVTVPTLAGQPLDVAKRRLDDLGLHPTEEGGGLFGVIFPSDWNVCETSPGPGAEVRPGSTIRLLIDRPGVC